MPCKMSLFFISGDNLLLFLNYLRIYYFPICFFSFWERYSILGSSLFLVCWFSWVPTGVFGSLSWISHLSTPELWPLPLNEFGNLFSSTPSLDFHLRQGHITIAFDKKLSWFKLKFTLVRARVFFASLCTSDGSLQQSQEKSLAGYFSFHLTRIWGPFLSIITLVRLWSCCLNDFLGSANENSFFSILWFYCLFYYCCSNFSNIFFSQVVLKSVSGSGLGQGVNPPASTCFGCLGNSYLQMHF